MTTMRNKKLDKMVTIVSDVPVEDTRVRILTLLTVGVNAVDGDSVTKYVR